MMCSASAYRMAACTSPSAAAEEVRARPCSGAAFTPATGRAPPSSTVAVAPHTSAAALMPGASSATVVAPPAHGSLVCSPR